jgi:hypothetical protein
VPSSFGCLATTRSCAIRCGRAGEAGPGDATIGGIRHLVRGEMSGPIHRLTLSKNGRGSLLGDDGMSRLGLSRTEMGVFPSHYGVSASSCAVFGRRVRTPFSRSSASEGYHMSELLKVCVLRAKETLTPRRTKKSM